MGLAAIAACLLLLLFALAMCWFSAFIGLLTKTPQGVQWFGFLAMFPPVFGSNLLVPAATMPGWLQAFVKVNPVTDLTEAERGLLTGGPVARPDRSPARAPRTGPRRRAALIPRRRAWSCPLPRGR